MKSDATEFEVSARLGSEVDGILSNLFLDRAFQTVSFRIRVAIHDNGTWSYEEHTEMRIPDRQGLVDHVDRNTLTRILIGYFLPIERSGSFVDVPSPDRMVIDCDVSAIAEPDALALDCLARLELVARRFGATIRLLNADAELVELIAWAGLAGVLEVEPSAVEVDRQVEQREQLRVDEEVHRGDDAV